MDIRRGWRPYAYNCIFVVYSNNNQGKYFFIREKSGSYQGISYLDFCGHPESFLLNQVSILPASGYSISNLMTSFFPGNTFLSLSIYIFSIPV